MTFVTNNNQETILSGTWDNSSTIFSRLGVNVEDLNSHIDSTLLSLSSNGAAKFQVYKGGTIKTTIGNNSMQITPTLLILTDTILLRDAANIFAQRNGTAAQTFRLYNSYVNSTTYERASLGWNASAFTIQTETESQLARSLVLGTSSTPRITISSVGDIDFNTSSTAARIKLHGKNTVELYNWGSTAPAQSLTNNIRFIGYQTTNVATRPIVEIKDLRGGHRNNFSNGQLGPGLSFSFEVLNNAGGELAEKTVGGLFSVIESNGAATFGLAFASNGFTEKMRLSNAGNLGIGLTAPTERLHVSGNAIITSSLVINPNPALINTVNNVLDIYRNGSGGDGAAISFKRDGGQTVARIVCHGTASYGYIGLDPYINYSPIQTGIQHPFVFAAAAPSGSSFKADFGLSNGLANATLNIYNSSAGFEVQGINLSNRQTSNRSDVAISWYNWQTQLRSKIVGEAIGQSTSGGALNFYTTNNSTGSESRMYLDSSGNVGIGTTAPSAVLHVNSTSTGDILNLHNSGISRFRVDKDGFVRVGYGSTTANTPSIASVGYQYTGYGFLNSYQPAIWMSANVKLLGNHNTNTFVLASNMGLTWCDQANVPFNSVNDTGIFRESAGVLGQRSYNNNTQKYRVYNTYSTAASSYEALEIGHRLYSTSQFQYVSAITSGTGAANIGMAIVPAGTGAFTLTVPDGGIAGGDPRGNYAIDFQRVRSASTQAATGNNSIILNGQGNTASNSHTIAGGFGCVASNYASVALGDGATANATRSIALGWSVTAAGTASFATGFQSEATGAYTATFGLQSSAKMHGQVSQSAGSFSNRGDAQRSVIVMRRQTTDNTPTEMFLDGTSARASIPNNTRWFADVRVVGTNNSSGGGALTGAFHRRCLIRKFATALSTELIGTVQTIGTDIGTNGGSPPSGWDVTLSADTTNGSLKIEVTGTDATTIRWVADVNLTEIAYA